jgi:hypothetical protein
MIERAEHQPGEVAPPLTSSRGAPPTPRALLPAILAICTYKLT